jgi:hypothetical protein
MKTAKYCPDCGEVLAPGSTRCACGWTARPRRSAETEHDGGCDFTLGKRRCPLSASWSTNVRQGGPWYCCYHSRNPGKGAGAAYALDEIERTMPEKPRDWRDKAVNDQILKLGLARKPGEPASTHIARCYAAMPKALLEKLGLFAGEAGEQETA